VDHHRGDGAAVVFGCADFLVLLGLDHMDRRYVRFFLGGT